MLVVGLLGIGHRQLWDDERATWWAASLGWGDFGRLLGHFDIVLAPYYALMHLWVESFGSSAAALRLPSVLAMAAAAGVLTLLGRRMFDARVGLTAGLIFAVLPITTRYAQEARPYAFAVLAALAATLLLLRAIERPSRGRWTAYALTIPCMGMAHLVTVLILGAHLLPVLGPSGDRRARLRTWSTVVGIGLLPVLALVVLGQGQSHQVSWISSGWPALEAFPQQLFHSRTAEYAVIGTAVFGLLLTRRWSAFLLCWALLPPLLLFAVQGIENLFLMRYLLFTCPAWVLLAASGLCSAVRFCSRRFLGHADRPSREYLVAVVMAALLASVCAPDIQAVRSDPLPGEPDWHRAAVSILARERPGDGIAYAGTRGYRQLSMSYEFRNVADPPRDVFLGQTPQFLGAFLAKDCFKPDVCAQGFDRIWLVSSGNANDPFGSMPTYEADLLKSRYHRDGATYRVAGLRVLLLVRSHSS
jgi:mannosyltransferase